MMMCYEIRTYMLRVLGAADRDASEASDNVRASPYLLIVR